jgi:hypothetical protein
MMHLNHPTMDHRAIKSEINKVTSELRQLGDRQFFSADEEAKKRPALERKLMQLEEQLGESAKNIEVKE